MARGKGRNAVYRSQEEIDKNFYFGEAEEQAFRDYASSNDKAFKDEIFESVLYPAFAKIVECQIRSYGLWVLDEDYNTTFHNAMSFIISKLDYFKPEKNKKAFSYFGTICKRHLISERKRSMKNASQSVPYDNAVQEYDIENITEEDNTPIEEFMSGLIKEYVKWLKKVVKNENPYDVLTEAEVAVGNVLIMIFSDVDNFIEIIECMGGDVWSRNSKRTKKYNKTNILYYIQGITMLPMGEVRAAIKRFKTLYLYVRDYYSNKAEEDDYNG